MVKLSICMPTFNRQEKALNQLKTLLTQLTQINDKQNVEIIVSDNASSDDTFNLLNELCKDFSCEVKVFKQPKNLGLVGNIYFLFSKAKGEYVWYVGDDDLLYDNSVSKVLRLVDSKHNFYLLNFTVGNKDFLYFEPLPNLYSLISDKTWGGLGLLSVQVLKKEAFNHIYCDKSEISNLCQPVAVSLYGLYFAGGQVDFSNNYLDHNQGDYSWKSEAVKVMSVYLFQSILSLKRYSEDSAKVDKILNLFAQTDTFVNASVSYMIRSFDFKFVCSLIKYNLLFTVLCRRFILLLRR